MKLNAEAWYYIAVVARILCVVLKAYLSGKRDSFRL